MNFNSFREEDLMEAIKEQLCIVDCLQATVDHVSKGEFSFAMQRTLDAEQSIMELKRLAGKKLEEARLANLVKDLTNKGIDVSKLMPRLVYAK